MQGWTPRKEARGAGARGSEPEVEEAVVDPGPNVINILKTFFSITKAATLCSGTSNSGQPVFRT